MAMRRTQRVAVDAFGGEVFTAPWLDGVIESKDPLPFRRKAHEQQTEPDGTRSQGRPARPIQDAVRVDDPFFWLHPMTRKPAVTVRLPGARLAPTNKSWGCCQTGLEKSGATSTISGHHLAGRVSMGKTPFGEEVFFSLRCLLVFFQRLQMAKVELSRWKFFRSSTTEMAPPLLEAPAHSEASKLSMSR